MVNVKIQAALVLVFVVLSAFFVHYVLISPNVEMEVGEGNPRIAEPGENLTFEVRARSNISGDYKIFVFNNFYEDVNTDEEFVVYLSEDWENIPITVHIPEDTVAGKDILVQVRDNSGDKKLVKGSQEVKIPP